MDYRSSLSLANSSGFKSKTQLFSDQSRSIADLKPKDSAKSRNKGERKKKKKKKKKNGVSGSGSSESHRSFQGNQKTSEFKPESTPQNNQGVHGSEWLASLDRLTGRRSTCAIGALLNIGAQPVKLPPLPSSSAAGSSKGAGNSRSWSRFGKWLKGPETVMDIDIDPDELDAYTKRWAMKWHYFQETFPEASHTTVDGRDAMRSRVEWLERDFSRIVERIHELQEHETDYEICAGSMFANSLIQDCQPDLVSVMTTTKRADESSGLPAGSSSELGTQINQLKSIEKSHQFALRCVNEMITRKQTLAAQAKFRLRGGIPGSPADSESASLRSAASRPVVLVDEPPEATRNIQWAPGTELQALGRQSPVTETAPTAQSDLNTLRSALPDLRNPRHEPRNAHGPNAPNTLVSSADSHMKNLTALLGISFFGASITWSTIFSGTRGNLGLISWAACLFIVGAISAAGASMLVLPDEDIVAMYPPVRWTVRVFSLVAMVHVLGGMFLIAIAILALDYEDALRGGRGGTQSAGAYAIAASTTLVLVSGGVWRRYTRRTWFR
ncbi:hypothetical protein C8R46DRAFT_1186364 [Mycena filopes]|nr:hypothetical protein C8R46DRAFT_1186364 [Mycena filopes]